MNAVLQAARPLGFIAAAGAAVAVWLAMAPADVSDPVELPSAARYERLISQALNDNEANDARTDSAPQQQVVNGWVARDLLTIIANTNADLLEAAGALAESTGAPSSSSDQRVPALLLLMIIVVAWDGLTRYALVSPTARLPTDAPSTPVP